MPVPLMFKLFGLIVAGMIFLGPANPTTQISNSAPTKNNLNLEDAQLLADKTQQKINVWMDKSGHVYIEPASMKPVEPYTILHSTWVPRKKGVN